MSEVEKLIKKLNEILDTEAIWLEMPMTRKVITWSKEFEVAWNNYKQQLQEMLRLWDKQSHMGIVLQETEWLLGEFGRLRKLLGEG